MIEENLKNEIVKFLKERLTYKRYMHSVSVAFTAMNLALLYKVDKEEAFLAGLLHDIAKYYNEEQMLEKCNEYGIELSEDDKISFGILHSYVGAYEAKKLFNVNEDIFNAIYTHTLGDTKMSMLQKIIFTADFIEPMREFDEDINEIIKMAYIDIDKCMMLMYENIMSYLKFQQKPLHKKTIEVYNYLKELYG